MPSRLCLRVERVTGNRRRWRGIPCLCLCVRHAYGSWRRMLELQPMPSRLCLRGQCASGNWRRRCELQPMPSRLCLRGQCASGSWRRRCELQPMPSRLCLRGRRTSGSWRRRCELQPMPSRLSLRVERVTGNRRRRCGPLPPAPGCALGIGVLPTACIGSVPAGGRAAGRIPLCHALPQKSPRGSLIQCSSMRPELM